MKTREQELLEKIQSLEKTVGKMEDTICKLSTKVNELETRVVIAESVTAVATITSGQLQKQLEIQEQYSRRNCLIIDGIKTMKEETEDKLQTHVTKVINGLVENASLELDKMHRIGARKNNSQSTIVRFKGHSTVKKVYDQRKQNKGITIRPALTKFRNKQLAKARELSERVPIIDFVFADILGNLKVRFVKPFRNRNVHNFYDFDELKEILVDIDFEELTTEN